jgi:hypothetical protein
MPTPTASGAARILSGCVLAHWADEQKARLAVLVFDASSCGTTEADLASTG